MTKEVFVLKDSPAEVIEAAEVDPQGRKFDKEYGEKPGGIRLDDIALGMKYASLAITDDEEGTLAEVGKSNPWQVEALKIITGSEEEAHKPLTTILEDHMGLTCDKIINITGATPGGHPLDTQGYIAHNDEVIVLAYRCTTSIKDWMTNLNTTSSQWEIEEDLAQGYSGRFSGLEGLCCFQEGEYKPRVHTGFYNNFLSTLPSIKESIEPLLQPDQPARKLYVVGHSLGAGIATMAACYFVLEHDWVDSPHKLVVVTAGSPRACQESMKAKIDEKMDILKPLDKAVICRIVRDDDVVPKVPPAIFGFQHLDKLVYITDDGEILINPKVEDAVDEEELKNMGNDSGDAERKAAEEEEDEDEDEGEGKYERMLSMIPKPFRDHMPEFYLKPLLHLFEAEAESNDKGGDTENASLLASTIGSMKSSASKMTALSQGATDCGTEGDGDEEHISEETNDDATLEGTDEAGKEADAKLSDGNGGSAKKKKGFFAKLKRKKKVDAVN